MRLVSSFGLLSALLLLAPSARPCGGAFGSNYTINPAQQLVIGYRNGIETYVFNPKFCGNSDDFGLILPVPTALTRTPTLGKAELYTDLASLAAPTIVTVKQCQPRGTGAPGATLGVGGAASNGGGATVVDRGQVGVFDWALLKADSVSSFTDWLTANGYPYKTDTQSVFQTYVDNGWYFVAFKVSASGATSGVGGGGSGGNGPATTPVGGTSGAYICGSFGPVTLAFNANAPVIPARIASVSSSSLSWDVFAIGATQLRDKSGLGTVRYSGAISDADLSAHVNVAPVANPGERLTELLFTQTPSADIELEPDPNQADFRRVETRYEYVTGCTGGASSAGSTLLSGVGGLFSAGGFGAGGASQVGGAASSASSATGPQDPEDSDAGDWGCTLNRYIETEPSGDTGILAMMGALGAVVLGRRRGRQHREAKRFRTGR